MIDNFAFKSDLQAPQALPANSQWPTVAESDAERANAENYQLDFENPFMGVFTSKTLGAEELLKVLQRHDISLADLDSDGLGQDEMPDYKICDEEVFNYVRRHNHEEAVRQSLNELGIPQFLFSDDPEAALKKIDHLPSLRAREIAYFYCASLNSDNFLVWKKLGDFYESILEASKIPLTQKKQALAFAIQAYEKANLLFRSSQQVHTDFEEAEDLGPQLSETLAKLYQLQGEFKNALFCLGNSGAYFCGFAGSVKPKHSS